MKNTYAFSFRPNLPLQVIAVSPPHITQAAAWEESGVSQFDSDSCVGFCHYCSWKEEIHSSLGVPSCYMKSSMGEASCVLK